MKTCALCGEEKPLDDYYRDRRAKDGRMWRCKACVKAKQKTYNCDTALLRERERRYNNSPAGKTRDQRWKTENRDAYLAMRKRLNAENREQRAREWAAYYVDNRDELAARRKAKYDPEKKRASRKPGQGRLDRERRRARLLAAFVEDVPFDEILRRDAGHCGICGEPIMEDTIELDHIIPLATGGTHERTNVQLAHLSCNRRKGMQVDFSLRAA